MQKHIVNAAEAAKVFDWLQTRGGLALWKSADLSDPGKSWTCPLNDENGERKGKPIWQADSTPYRIITDPSDVEVHVPKEVARFHVALRPKGFRLVCTDGSTRKIQKAVEKANEQHCQGQLHAFYAFDYSTQEAVIFVPDRILPLPEYIQECQTNSTQETKGFQTSQPQSDLHESS